MNGYGVIHVTTDVQTRHTHRERRASSSVDLCAVREERSPLLLCHEYISFARSLSLSSFSQCTILCMSLAVSLSLSVCECLCVCA